LGGIEVPYDQLNPDTLRALVEEFITREGTDYGQVEVDLETKVMQVLRQLKKGEAAIVFDEKSETCNIVPRDELKERS
jgi:uncharacterized protein YheU (UPF0270 family)